jgi:hypothetical protein
MSSEPSRQPASGSQPRRRPADPEPPAAPAGAAELARARGYDPDNPATWPQSPSAAVADEPAALPGPQREESRQLTDAKAMRALAHPVRMEMLRLFAYHETLTATQASELLGESPANCAFHLRTLAKYGYVKEAGGGRGRERPWTMANRSISMTTVQDDPAAAVAAQELGRAILESWFDHARQVFGSANQVPGWDSASGFSFHNAFLTAPEAEALRAEMRQLLERYEPRLTDPTLRPDGARPVEWTIFSAPVEAWSPPPGDDSPG